MDPSKYARSRPPKQLAGLTHQKLSSVVVSRTTGAQGIAVVVRPASDSGTDTFTVLAVSKSGAVYDPAQNEETTDCITIFGLSATLHPTTASTTTPPWPTTPGQGPSGADRYDGVGHQHDDAVALAVGPEDGWLYVTGDSWGGERKEYNYLTIEYPPARAT